MEFKVSLVLDQIASFYLAPYQTVCLGWQYFLNFVVKSLEILLLGSSHIHLLKAFM